MTIDLAEKRFAILGLPGSGKTVLAKSILASNPRHIVIDPNGEYAGFRRWRPKRIGDQAELEAFMTEVVIPWKPDLLMLDESNMYIPRAPARLSPAFTMIANINRHLGISVGTIARRPSQIHTDLLELSSYLFVFNLPGRNDRRALEDYHVGLGYKASEIPKYYFLVAEAGAGFTLHAPVDFVE